MTKVAIDMPSFATPGYIAKLKLLAKRMGNDYLMGFVGKGETEQLLRNILLSSIYNSETHNLPCSIANQSLFKYPESEFYQIVIDHKWIQAIDRRPSDIDFSIHSALCNREGNITTLWCTPLLLADLEAYCDSNKLGLERKGLTPDDLEALEEEDES